jgi:hypothetical protein
MFGIFVESLRPMKKYLVKYFFEFVVIVLGISVSFYINEAKKTKEFTQLSKNIQQNLLNEIYNIEKYIQERELVLREDIETLSSIWNVNIGTDSLIQLNNSKKLNIGAAIFYFRGFKPPASVYNSLVNDGSLRYVKSLKVKEGLDKMHNIDDYNFNQFIEGEEVVKNKIVTYLQIHYPNIIINGFNNKNNKTLKNLKKAVDKDLTLRAFLAEKRSAMRLKMAAIKNYKDSLEKVKEILLKP